MTYLLRYFSYILLGLAFLVASLISESKAIQMNQPRFHKPTIQTTFITKNIFSYLFSENNSYSNQKIKFLPLGSNAFGQDLFLLCMRAFYRTLLIALIATILTFLMSFLLALLSLFSNSTELLLLWIGGNFLQSIPLLFILIALASLQMNGMNYFSKIVLSIFIPLVGSIPLARYLSHQIKTMWNSASIRSARKAEWSLSKIIFYGFLPAFKNYLLSYFGLIATQYCLLETILSFIGLPLLKGTSLGQLISQSQNIYVIIEFPWVFWTPVAFLFIIMIHFQYLNILYSKEKSHE